jgi:hypothetical protein
MKVINGRIVQITVGELYKIYIEREWDNLLSFPDFVGVLEQNGTEVTE